MLSDNLRSTFYIIATAFLITMTTLFIFDYFNKDPAKNKSKNITETFEDSVNSTLDATVSRLEVVTNNLQNITNKVQVIFDSVSTENPSTTPPPPPKSAPQTTSTTAPKLPDNAPATTLGGTFAKPAVMPQNPPPPMSATITSSVPTNTPAPTVVSQPSIPPPPPPVAPIPQSKPEQFTDLEPYNGFENMSTHQKFAVW